MDRARVERVARQHKELAGRRDEVDPLDTEAARREEADALEQLLRRIARECDEYCAAYNEAFGSVRIRSEAHAETVVVRSQLDLQDTVVFRRTLPSHGHSGNLEAHRYHYSEQPVDLPVGLRRSVGNALTITHDGRDVTVTDLVLELLSAFSEQIARTDHSSAIARADTKQ